MRRVSTWVILMLTLIFSFCGKPKYPRVKYLSPLNRDDIGFVDQDTWQQITYGSFVPESEVTAFRKMFIRYPMQEKTFLELKTYNTTFKGLKPRDKNIYSVDELLKIDIDSTLLEKIPVEQIDPDLYKIAEIKRIIFDKACANALLLSLYNWLLNFTSSEKMQITTETLSALNANYFPPQPFYFNGTEEAIALLEPMLQQRGFKYEVISETAAEEGFFRCKMILHYKMKDLILKNEELRRISEIQ